MFTRRDLLRTAISGVPLALIGCDEPTSTPPKVWTKPNVLMIAIDDLNDWVGFLGGHPQARTPNLDRLAAGSVVFDRAYCNAPVCNPSRVAALTGLLPQTSGVFFNNQSFKTVDAAAWSRMLPFQFQRSGYDVELIGKIHHVYTSPPDPAPDPAPASNLQCSGAPIQPTRGLVDWAAIDADETLMPDSGFVAQAAGFLEAPRNKPFFLGVGFLRTHLPWYVPRKYFDLFPLEDIQLPPAPPGDLDDVPPAGIDTALTLGFHECITRQGLWASAVQAYLASIAFVDAKVGELLDALEASAQRDNTLVVLWSDHGFHLGEKFHWSKLALWERATRIPFLIRPAPRMGIPAARVPSCVSLVDLYPTLTELCGLAAMPGRDGRSLVPLLRQPELPWDRPVLITNNQVDHAVRSNRWRYIRYANGDEELYDHDSDPGEITNLAGDPSLAGIKTTLAAYMPA